MKILKIHEQDDGVSLTYENKETYDYSFLWLRDHCPQSVNPETGQREVDTFQLPFEIVPESIQFDDSTLTIQWKNESHVTHFDIQWLYDLTVNSQNEYCEAKPQRTLWNAQHFQNHPPTFHDFELIKSGSEPELFKWLSDVMNFGFSLLKGVTPSIEGIEEAIRTVTYIRETIFGGMWDFKADGERADSAYSNGVLAQHTDATYSFDPPMQILSPLTPAIEGGESIINDGFYAANQLRIEDPEAFELLCQIPITGQYLENGIYLKAERPLFQLNSLGELSQVSFNHHDRAPKYLPLKTSRVFYRGYARFQEMVQSPENQYIFKLEKGQLILFDNTRVLHGRKSFSGHRHMAGAYINREDFLSKYRLLSSKL